MITNIFNKNYLLELDADLQTHIKSFIPQNILKIIFLNEHIPKLKKKNKRFYNKVEKQGKYYFEYDLIDEINSYFISAFFGQLSYADFKDVDNKWYLCKNIIKYIERAIIVIFIESFYNIPILKETSMCAVYTKIINDLDDIRYLIENSKLYFTFYKKKQINKLIDIFTEENQDQDQDPFFIQKKNRKRKKKKEQNIKKNIINKKLYVSTVEVKAQKNI